MKIAAVVVVALLGFVGYRMYEGSGKMSSARLEAFLDERGSTHWRPNEPPHMQCRDDPAGKWDYICTEPVSGLSWGYDVDRSGITRGASLGHLDR